MRPPPGESPSPGPLQGRNSPRRTPRPPPHRGAPPTRGPSGGCTAHRRPPPRRGAPTTGPLSGAEARDVRPRRLAAPARSPQAEGGRRDTGPLLELLPRLHACARGRGRPGAHQHLPPGHHSQPDGPGRGLLPGAHVSRRQVLVHHGRHHTRRSAQGPRPNRAADRRAVRCQLTAHWPAVLPDDVHRPERPQKHADRSLHPHSPSVARLLHETRSRRRDEPHHQRRRHHPAGNRISTDQRDPGRAADPADRVHDAEREPSTGRRRAGGNASDVRGHIVALRPRPPCFPPGPQPRRRCEREPPGEPVRGARSASLQPRGTEHRGIF